MKKNIIALLISTTLIGGIGTSAYAAVGPNVTSKTYTTQCKQNGNLSYSYFNYLKGILSGKNLTNTNTVTNTNAGTNTNTGTNTDTNTQVNSGQTQTSQQQATPIEQGKPIEQATGTTVEQTKPTTSVPETTTGQTTPATTPTTEPTTTNVNDKFMAKVEQLIFQKVNEERTKAGVQALTYNSTMEKYARIKSQDMGDKNYFSHEDLQGNLMTVKMKNDGVNYKAWGENIAYIGGVTDENALANQFMTNWMNSPGHRANILSTNFSSIGVGVYKIGNKVYATQEFYK
jgi:uncharacterized protein YkwD